MPVIEAAVAVGYVVAWALRKARRAAGKLDAVSDAAIDQAMDRLDNLVRDKLSGHPGLTDLDHEATEAASDADDSDVDQLTRDQLEMSVKAALARDADFARAVGELISILQRGDAPAAAGASTHMTAKASGHARIYQAGHDISVSDQ